MNAAILFLIALFPITAHAETASLWKGIDEAQVRLIAGHVPGEGDLLALQFRMHPKWKVYWRSPGDAGFPPVPDWTGSKGVSGMQIAWPLPERFVFYGLETYGYGDKVILPVRVRRASGNAHVQLDLFYAACAEICVPVTTQLSLSPPEGVWPDNAAIANALAQVPEQSPPGLAVQAEATAKALDVRVQGAGPLLAADIIVEGSEDYLFETRSCRETENGAQCTVAILDRPAGKSMDGMRLTFTIWNPGLRAEVSVPVTEAARSGG